MAGATRPGRRLFKPPHYALWRAGYAYLVAHQTQFAEYGETPSLYCDNEFPQSLVGNGAQIDQWVNACIAAARKANLGGLY